MSPPFWPVRVEITVPWRDLDAAGHVNNAVYFSYMETARAETHLRMKGTRDLTSLDIILAHTSCDYRSPANFGETLVVSVTPLRVGQSSYQLGYTITEIITGRLVSEGESIQVAFDYKTNQKKPLPPEVRARLEEGLKSETRPKD